MTAPGAEQIIASDPHGPFPEQGQKIRCYLLDGQVVDGYVQRIHLDLDRVQIEVTWPAPGIKLTPANGDTWELLE